MQTIDATSSAGTTYTAAQVLAQWAAPAAKHFWTFDWLNPQGSVIADLTPAVDFQTSTPEVSHDTTSVVHRTLRFRTQANPGITPLQDLVKPHYRLVMSDGGYVDYPLGVFYMLPPEKKIYDGVTWNEWLGADFAQLLVDSGFDVSFGIFAGVDYMVGLKQILATYGGLTPLTSAPFGFNIQNPGKLLPTALNWDQTKTRMDAANLLLDANNYVPAWWDENGVMRSSLVPDYSSVMPSYVFDVTKGTAMAVAPLDEKPDVSSSQNHITVLVEPATGPAFSAVWQNLSPRSPISQPQSKRKKTRLEKLAHLADSATAYGYARRLGQEAARAYLTQVMDTLPWPWSQDRDIYGLIFNSSDEGGVQNFNYVEARWTHRMGTKAYTTHTLEKLLL